ncbi:MAG: chitobiase/beta-hexosaminidase C-terminal domain-containing protein, partial [Verrucomicrobia bacterium]|nr:chitobiase/beta-hexosaminidase C-terminal domain-containing protein [Verrucomicrobiota bacterium]
MSLTSAFPHNAELVLAMTPDCARPWYFFPQRKALLASFCLPFFASTSAKADILITEFMADNQTTLVDEDGDDPDWIELFNSGAASVSLAGYCLTDDPSALDKWTLPDVNLGSGEFLVVFASGKDRTVSGLPLHTNFSLQASGEYLALVAPDTVTVLQAFAPEFSRQEPDESFGVPFDGISLVSAKASARVLIPTSGSLGSSWRANGFNDGSWQSANLGVGFGLTVPGFTVREVRSNGSLVSNLSDADDLLSGFGVGSETTATMQVVDLFDSGGTGRFTNDLPFPNGGGDDFTVQATGIIQIPVAGTWTFGTTSDDGLRVRINGTNVINDDALHGVEDRFGSRSLSAGSHTIELVFFERGGGAEVELFAARGNFTSFNSNFKLIGDIPSGGLAVSTSLDSGSVGTNIEAQMKNVRGTAYLRVPFSVGNVADLKSLSLTMRYNDGFAAYVNGVEVARRNAPADPVWNSTATASRSIEVSLLGEGINASAALSAMVSGTNTLAIHGLNISAGDGTFLIAPELVGGGLGVGSPAYFVIPTPGAVNSATSALGRVLDPDVAPKRGTYATAQTVTLTAATPGSTIRYTTDGSTPTASTGSVYSTPLSIRKTTVLRVAAFRSGFEASTVKTHTYLFPDDVIRQPESAPAGWPTAAVNGQ